VKLYEPSTLQKKSVKLLLDYEKNPKGHQISHVVFCFCAQELDKLGFSQLSYQEYESGDQKAVVCAGWLYDHYWNKLFNQIVSV